MGSFGWQGLVHYTSIYSLSYSTSTDFCSCIEQDPDILCSGKLILFGEKGFTWAYTPCKELAPFGCCKTVSGPIYTSRLCSCNSPTAASAAAGAQDTQILSTRVTQRQHTEIYRFHWWLQLWSLLMHTSSGISIQDPAQEAWKGPQMTVPAQWYCSGLLLSYTWSSYMQVLLHSYS